MKLENQQHYTIGPVELWTSQGSRKGAYVEIKDGSVVQISDQIKNPDSRKIPHIDGKGMVLMPAGVDAQVHLRVPGQEHKETAETGLKAAVKGGYSAILTMPNTNPTIDTAERLLAAKEMTSSFEKHFGVDVFWTGAITKNLNTSTITPIEQMVSAGMKALTNDGLGVLSDSVMDEAFARLAPFGIPLLQHAEFLGHGGSLAPSSVQRKIGAKPYPESAELEMVERDLRVLSKHPKTRYHILHVTSRHTIPLVQQAKSRGLKVTCEVTPHHLYFSGEDIDPTNKSFKMNPPLRSPEDREAFWKYLESADIDFVSTDHAPHEKLVKSGDFDECAFGTIGLETTLGVLTWGYKKGLLSQKRFVETFSQKPAEFLRLDESYGDIREGLAFRAILFDINAPERRVLESDFASLSKNSCFIGSKLPGRIHHSFLMERCFSF